MRLICQRLYNTTTHIWRENYWTQFTEFTFVLQEKINASTRGIWKVLSMVFYLSNRFTKPIMFGIILKSHLSSMLWHKFHEDIIMQKRKKIL